MFPIGCSPSIRSHTAFATTIIGIASNIPGTPQSQLQNMMPAKMAIRLPSGSSTDLVGSAYALSRTWPFLPHDDAPGHGANLSDGGDRSLARGATAVSA